MSSAQTVLSYSQTVAPGGRGGVDQEGIYYGPSTDALTSAILLTPTGIESRSSADEVEYDAFDIKSSVGYQQLAALESGDMFIQVSFTTSTSDFLDVHTIDVDAQYFAGLDSQAQLLSDQPDPPAYNSGGSATWATITPSTDPPGSIYDTYEVFPGVDVGGVSEENNNVQQYDDVTAAAIHAYQNNSDLIFNFGENTGGLSNVTNVFLTGFGIARGIPVVVGAAPVTTSDNTPVALFAATAIYDDAVSPMETLTIHAMHLPLDGSRGVVSDSDGLLSGSNLIKTGVGTYQLVGTPQDVTSDLQALLFTPAAFELAAGTNFSTDFTLSVQGTGGSVQSSTAVTVTPASRIVVNPQSNAIHDSHSSNVFGPLTITDPGLGHSYTVLLTVSDTATGDVTDANGLLSGDYLTKTGVGTYQLSGPSISYGGNPAFTDLTVATIDQELAAVQFTPTDHQVAPTAVVNTTIRLSAADLYNQKDTGIAATVAATAQADQPVIAGTHATTIAGQSPVMPFSGVTITNPDLDDTETAKISFASKLGVLSGAGVTQTSPGIYTAEGTPDVVTQDLQAVRFIPLPQPTTEFGIFDLEVTSIYGLRSHDNGTSITLNAVACYTRGTLIETDTGAVAVESLAIGDRVLTVSGEIRPIRWIGRRSYTGHMLWGQRELLPIRFTAGALGNGLPRRDLLVSPEHAMFLHDLLVPAHCLVNGCTIVQERSVDRVEYFHVELDSHDILLAEGTPSESYLDDDNRDTFHNASEYAALYSAVRGPAMFYSRRVQQGQELEMIRRELAAVALELLAMA